MSFSLANTNHVRPHAKASFIRPLPDNSKTEATPKEPVDRYTALYGMKYPVSRSDSSYKLDDLKAIDESKEKHLENWNSAHSKLFSEISKIQSLTTSIESETKQKSKKLVELTQRVESQQKIVLEFKIQNEKLSIQLNQEVQQRVSVLKKFYFIKELLSALQKKMKDLQKQLDACHEMKKAVDAHCKKNTNAVEDLFKKVGNMHKDYSEKICILNNALKNERHNNAALKEICEQQNLNAKKEHELHCKLVEKYQEELKSYSEHINSEKRKVLDLQQEKDNMYQRISELEKDNEAYLNRLKDIEQQLKIEVESKLETEKKYESEKITVNNLNKKYEELEELKAKQKTEFEENCMIYETKIKSLENSICELKQKLEECESESENLKVALEEREKEKCSLETEVLAITKENTKLKDKSVIDAKIADEVISNLMKEKNDLTASLSLVKKDIELALSNNENLLKTCSEKDAELSQVAQELKVAKSTIEELSVVQKKYDDAIHKMEKIEADAQLKLDILNSKEHEIKELLEMKLKYDECLQNIKDLEESMDLKTKEIQLKDKKIEELMEMKLKYDECLQKIKNLEESLNSKTEQLQFKDDKIKELHCIEDKYVTALKNITGLENELSSKNELLISKDDKIKELNSIEEKYVAAINHITGLENDLFSKNELLISKEQNIEELINVEKTYAETLEKMKKLEDDINCKNSLVYEQEVKIADLNIRLNKKNIECEKLEYENLEMENNLLKEKENVQVCLECEIMKDKIQNLEHLQSKLMDTEKELMHEKEQTSDVLKLLRETEDNFDEMRLKKEKEILKCKDTIQTLLLELKTLRVKANEAEKFKSEIDELQLKVEERTSLNAKDMQSLKSEIEKLKLENEALKIGKNLSESDVEALLKNQVEVDLPKNNNESNVMRAEADSLHEDDLVANKDTKCKSTPVLKTCKLAKRKVASKREYQSTPLVSEKRKRAWETESSGSECLEIVFDNGGKKVMGLTPKTKISIVSPVKTTPLLIKRPLMPSQDKRRDMLEMIDEEITTSETVISFSSPMNWRSTKSNENKDFLSSKRNIQIKRTNSPWMERNANTELKRTPSTPADRKFFKTPLKERDTPFKKPELKNMWF